MITKCFKLVQINVKDILPNEPHVVLMKDIKKDETKIAVGLLNAATPDWALHVVGASVGVFNMESLITAVEKVEVVSNRPHHD